jgi:hypothetical protein
VIGIIPWIMGFSLKRKSTSITNWPINISIIIKGEEKAEIITTDWSTLSKSIILKNSRKSSKELRICTMIIFSF